MTFLFRPAASLWLRLIAGALVVAVLVFAARQARPPRELTIETGPVGGSYHVAALEYKRMLAKRGLTVNVRPKANSLEILGDVADPASGVDVGFIAQDVSAARNSPVYSVGQIQLQPLFIFASASLGRRATIDDLRGRRIVMPPQNSATSDAALRVFAQYDISVENTSFTYAPLADAVRDLRAGRFQAGVFMLAPENEVVRTLMSDSSLNLLPMTEVKAVANHLPFLRPVVLPRGIYNIADAIPPNDIPMVAATVGVVVRDGLHPFVLYALMDALTTTHRDAGFLNAAGDFPTLVGSQLEMHPLATDYYQSGLSWSYRMLPPWLASAFDAYSVHAIWLSMLIAALLLSGWVAAVFAALLRVVACVMVGRLEARFERQTNVQNQRTSLAAANALVRFSLPAQAVHYQALAERLARLRSRAERVDPA